MKNTEKVRTHMIGLAIMLGVIVISVALFYNPHRHSTKLSRNEVRMQFCLKHTQTWEDLRECYRNV